MRRVLNWLLVLSIGMGLIFGGLLYRTYQKSKTTDTTLLELNAALYQNPVEEKEGRVDDVSIQIIFYTSIDQTTLQDVVIEVLHCKDQKLTYLSVPTDTDIIVNSRLYQKLTALYPEMPQYFRLDQLPGLFDSEKRYAYAQLILDAMLSIDSSYYTVIAGDEATFEEYREALWKQYGDSSKAGIQQLLKNEYPKTTTNLSKKNKVRYAKYYAEITAENLTLGEAYGTRHTDSFEIDVVKFGVQMYQLQNDEPLSL